MVSVAAALIVVVLEIVVGLLLDSTSRLSDNGSISPSVGGHDGVGMTGWGIAHSGTKSCPVAKMGKRWSLPSMVYVSIFEKTSSQLRS